MQHLLDQLNSRSPTVQADALRDARALSPDDLLRLILCADKLQRVRLRRRFTLRVLVTGLFSVSLFVSGLFKYTIGHALNTCSYMVASVSTAMFYNTYRQARRQIRVILQEVYDTRFIPHLLRSIGGPHDEGIARDAKTFITASPGRPRATME